MARLWLRLYETSGDRTYLEAATKAVTFVASTQVVRSGSPHIHGAIAGSYPVYGRYERLKYPNWAAKFFIDACMALKMIEDGGEWFEFVG